MTIDHGIPVPRRRSQTWNMEFRAALTKMKPGDSVLIDDIFHYTHAYRIAKAEGIKIQGKKQDYGWRIWRRA